MYVLGLEGGRVTGVEDGCEHGTSTRGYEVGLSVFSRVKGGRGVLYNAGLR